MILSHVSAIGILRNMRGFERALRKVRYPDTKKGILLCRPARADANLLQSVQQAVDALRQCATDSGDTRQVVDARRLDAAQSAEVRK